jgi:chorismate mutase
MIPLLTYRFNLMASIAEAKAELQKIAFYGYRKGEFH